MEQAKATELQQPPVQSAIVRALDIRPTPIRWLWEGRIARGKVTLLVGHPGQGKSQITASMAAVVSTASLWPDGAQCESGNVVIFSSEDNPADTIRPRLEAAGADLSKVYIFDNEGNQGFNLKDGLGTLEEWLDDIGGAALIIVDPISAYLGDVDIRNNATVRQFVGHLSVFVEKHSAALVCITHLTKTVTREVMTKVGGSMALVAAARAVFVVTKDHEDDENRLFLPLKNNVGNDRTGLAFSVVSAEVHTDSGPICTSRVVWSERVVEVSADRAMTPDSRERQNATREVECWLEGLLMAGPVQASKAKEQAQHAGISDKQLRAARERLRIKPHKHAFDGGWWWRLPDCEGASNSEGADGNMHGILETEGHLPG